MPQFDFYTFSSQNFWVLLVYIFVYFFGLFFYLVRLAEVRKFRTKLIEKYSKQSVKVSLYSLYLKKIFKK